MKCHILFSGKNKKNISKCRLLKILPRVLSVKPHLNFMCYLCSLKADSNYNVMKGLSHNYIIVS